MTFDGLTPTQFEEFCYDLLREIGLQNVNWRKGTGYDSSPSDNGRDIECEYCRYDVLLQRTVKERWFIECKHYKKGVPFTELHGALSWACAENPDRLIIMVSNYLSNDCKSAISRYIVENKPRFKIEIWEKGDIERKAHPKTQLLKKYNIEYREQILDCISDIHVEYIKHMPYNTVDQLFEALDQMNIDELNTICELCSLCYCNDNNIEEILNNKKQIEHIKDIIQNLSIRISEQFAVQSFINTALSSIIPFVNIYDIDNSIIQNQNWLRFCIEHKDDVMNRCVEMYGGSRSEYDMTDDRIYELFYKSPDDIRAQTEKMFNIYNHFCENVIQYLLEHQYSPSDYQMTV